MNRVAVALLEGSRVKIVNGFYVKDVLKKMGFKYEVETRSWIKHVNNVYDARDLLVELQKKCVDAVDVKRALVGVEKLQKYYAELSLPVKDGLDYLPFQKEFVVFARSKKHVILADEMGLGKTIQAIALINYEQPKTTLVVCPAFLKFSWKEELEKWLVAEQKVKVLDAKDLAKETFEEEGVYVVNYDVLDRNSFQKKFDLVIYDEAHFLKNWKAKRTQNGLRIKGERYLFLTGTPILNASVDLVPILTKIAKEGTFDLPKEEYEKEMKKRYWDFAYRFCRVEQNRFGVKVFGVKDHDGLRELLSPYLIRRLKSQVLEELPKKIRKVVKVAPVERALVSAEKELFLKALRGDGKASKRKKASSSLSERSEDGLSFAELTSLSLSEAQSRLRTLVREKKTEQGLLPLVRHLLGLQKVSAVVDYVRNALENDVSHLVVMCWHKSVAYFISKELEKEAEVFLVLGDVDPEDRQRMVSEFQKEVENKPKVYVSTIKAGGLGITLTKANHVVFAETSYVPADVVQAEDRVHRVGQVLPVNVHFIVFKDSLDELILSVLEGKEEDVAKVLKQSNYEKTFELAVPNFSFLT